MTIEAVVEHQVGDTYYRVDGRDDIIASEFIVLKVTPRGVWIDDRYSITGRRFVLNDSHKRYAWPTLDEAIDSFLARKKRQLKILTAQVARVKTLAYNLTENREHFVKVRYLRGIKELDD